MSMGVSGIEILLFNVFGPTFVCTTKNFSIKKFFSLDYAYLWFLGYLPSKYKIIKKQL